MPIKRIKFSTSFNLVNQGIPVNQLNAAIEKKGNLNVWDVDGDGDVNDFDLKFFSIGVHLHEEYEDRVDKANFVTDAFNQDINLAGGTTIKWSQILEQDRQAILQAFLEKSEVVRSFTKFRSDYRKSRSDNELFPVSFTYNNTIYSGLSASKIKRLISGKVKSVGIPAVNADQNVYDFSIDDNNSNIIKNI